MRTTSLFPFGGDREALSRGGFFADIRELFSLIVETAMLSDTQRDRTNANCLPRPVLPLAQHFSVMAKGTRTRARDFALRKNDFN